MNQQILRVSTPAQIAGFLALPATVYSADPQWIPAAEKFPRDGAAFLALRDGRPVARCSARLRTGDATTGTVGCFEALNCGEAVAPMLRQAIAYLEACGVRRIIGPMDGDTWHRYRFNCGPYAAAPFVKEPWNPSYYPGLWEQAGFRVVETYDSYLVDDAAGAAAAQEKFHRRCLRNGFSFSPVTRRNYRASLPVIHQLSCRIFAENVLYSPIAFAEFERLYLPARALLAPGLSWIARQAQGDPVGYVFCFPDYAEAMRAMRGRCGFIAKIRFLRGKRKARRSCLKTLGVVPEVRGSGLTAALTHLIYKNSAELGYGQTLMCLMHSANDSHRFGGESPQPFRSYALYQFEP